MALTATPSDQALLLDLQAFDTTLQQVAHRAAHLPELAALASATAEREAAQRRLTELQGAEEDARAELTRTEADVAVVEARVARDRSRLAESSSVKDVAALEQELAALATRQSDLEDIELAVMDTVDQAAAAVATQQAQLADLDARIAELTASRDAATAALDEDRRYAEANRSTVAAQVPADLLALYEKQRARYGVGASMLRGGVSLASGVALNAHDMNAIRAAAPDAVLLCPDSNAILVRTNESGL
ncbi:MAG TPA: hypothetical protein VNT53_09895 [Pseudolysinimonas sp.]|nr:hypothetical protein [Pseudolysinimonas sp.]